jgi:hypothetical protein
MKRRQMKTLGAFEQTQADYKQLGVDGLTDQEASRKLVANDPLKENRTEKDKVVESSTTAEPKDEINEE